MSVLAVMRTTRVCAALLCAAGLGVLIYSFAGLIREFPGAAVLALCLEVPVVLVGYWLLRRLRPAHAPSRAWSWAAIAWGATAATGCALLANQGLTTIWSDTAGIGFASNWSAALTAPLNEELLKLCGVALITLAAPAVIGGPLDGMVIGALTGLGFQAMENVSYGLNAVAQFGATNPPLDVAISAFVRIIFTGLGSHWTMTAVSGAAIGFLAGRGWRRGALPAVACLLTAMAMHLFFDTPGPATALKVVVNLAVVTAFYLLLRRRYRARAREALGSWAEAGLLWPGEAAAILSRRSRRLALYRMPPGEPREQLDRHQQQLLTQIDQVAAN